MSVMDKLLSKHRRFLLFTIDFVTITFAYLFTWLLILGRADINLYYSLMVSSTFLFVSCFLIVYTARGMYDSLWRYAEIVEFSKCVYSSVVAVITFLAISLMIFTDRRIPLSVYGLSAAFASTFTIYVRLTYRMVRNTKIKEPLKCLKNV